MNKTPQRACTAVPSTLPSGYTGSLVLPKCAEREDGALYDFDVSVEKRQTSSNTKYKIWTRPPRAHSHDNRAPPASTLSHHPRLPHHAKDTHSHTHTHPNTENIELKKLVYLYLINYAKTQPELTLLAVNTFVKDANDPNPLIRALSVRTMGCIRVEKITEYLCEPLRKALRDDVSTRGGTRGGGV